MSIGAVLTAQHSRLTLFWVLAGLGLAAPWAITEMDWSRWRSAPTASQACAVQSVHDGDTIRVGCGGETRRIRFYCIDAPEIAQSPWGQESRDYLRRLAGGSVQIRAKTTDRYGRTVAEVLDVSGRNLNLALVEAGQAAVYGRYCQDRHYFSAQRRAQSERLGIWSQAGDHQQPWVHRHRSR